VVVPLAVNTDTAGEKFVMVRQRRIGNGHNSLEFPAGMLDGETHPLAVALNELREETGLEASAEDLKPLHKEPLYSSPGLCDEGIFYFGCRLSLPGPCFTALEGKPAGNAGENERITVTLKTRAEALREVTSLQTRLGFYLFQDYFAE
jgi:8-oxo-dGTP pyrophosphatase MutT (NUDIX family)